MVYFFPYAGHGLGIVIDLISLSFILVFTYYSWNLTMRAVSVTPILMMPKGALYICMPVSGALMIIYSVRNIIENFVRLFEKPSDARVVAAQATQP